MIPSVFRVSLFIFALCLGVLSMSSFARAMQVDHVRFGTYPDKTRMVFDLSDSVAFRAFSLDDPYRLVIDLPRFTWQAGTVGDVVAAHVTDVRHGALQDGVSRIVFDMDQPVRIKTAFTLPRQGDKPHRLVVDYTPISAADFVAKEKGRILGASNLTEIAAAASPEGSSAAPALKSVSASGSADMVTPPPAPKKPAPKKSAPKKPYKPLIVLDPGHGGVDPGAIGANKVYEKHVVLALAKELRAQLEDSGKYRVVMTRESDRFIKLRERVKFARKHEADLFISIHADSIKKKHVRGASFYTLSERASDAQTAALAKRENQADLIAGIDLSHEDQDVANILVDLAIRDTTNQGKFFANKIVDSFKGKGLRVLENPHRHAGFAVLKSPDIPSVLVEAGFMSNKKEAKQLNTRSHRRKIAAALKSSIDRYFAQVEKNHL